MLLVGYRQLLAPVLQVRKVNSKSLTTFYQPPGNSATDRIIVYKLEYRKVS